MRVKMKNKNKLSNKGGQMAPPKGHKPYPGCETGGRPREWTDERIEVEAEAFWDWLHLSNSFWFEQFAIERGYPDKYIVEFAKKNDKFRSVYEYAQSWQKSRLIMGGLASKLNSSIVKLVLGNTIGWSDRQQVSGDGVNPLAFILQNIDGGSKELVNEQE